GEADDWFASRTILLCTIAAVISIPSFIYWELKTPHPIVDLRLFKHTAVRVGTIMMAEVGAMLYALIFFIPVFASITLGFTATQTGELFIPGALMSAAMMPLIGSQLRKRDPRMIIIFGLFGMETALFLLSGFSAQTSAEQMFWPLLIRGGAMAFLFVPINATVLSQFRGPELGQVAGLMNLSRQIGGSVGIAAFSSLFTKYRAQIRTDLSPRVSLLEPNAYSAYRQSLGFIRGKLSSSVGFIQAHDAALRTLAGRLEKQVFVLGYCKIMATAGLVFAVSFVPLYFMRKPQGPIAAVDAH
ncbi:MAG: MFS transporter, partial [Bdellovibrionota bacterium]